MKTLQDECSIEERLDSLILRWDADIKSTEAAYKRFSKMSFHKIKQSGLYFEDFPVIQEALAFKMEHLMGLKND